MDIDTRLMSEPSQTSTSALTAPEKIQVELPANIVTTDDVSVIAEAAVKKQTDYTVKAFTRLYTDVLPKQLAPPVATSTLSDEQIGRIAQAAADKAAGKAVNKRYEKLDAMADTAMHRIYNLVNGAIWAAIPKWVYLVVSAIVCIAVGLGIWCYNLNQENTHLQKVEWLYRFERVSYDADGIRNMMLREEAMMVGDKHEQDSIKAMTIRLEQRKNADRTHVYFRPSDPWTPNSNNFPW